MRKGLSWDQFKRKLAAVVVIATMAIPSVASAAEVPDSDTSGVAVTYDIGTYQRPGGYSTYGVSWS
jgi:hypothetical protein